MTDARAPGNETRAFYTLDGLRGVAATSVAIHHLAGWSIGLRDPLPQAGLAVDMFFVMSGFVLTHAYQNRLDDGMTARRFVMMRLIRLWPLYLLGTALKLAGLVVLATSLGELSVAKIFWSFAFALFFLPTPAPLSLDGFPFPLNGPAWSLFFELVANFAWVGFLRRSQPIVLAALCGVAAIILLLSGDLSQAFWGGLPRVGFSFFAGILTYRFWKRSPENWRSGPWLAAPALIAALAIFAAPVERDVIAAYQFIVVMLCPVFVWVCAKIPAQGRLISMLNYMGIGSYGIYVLHDPIFYLTFRSKMMSSVSTVFDAIIVAMILILLVTIAPLLDRFFDRPARRWLVKWARVQSPRLAGADPQSLRRVEPRSLDMA